MGAGGDRETPTPYYGRETPAREPGGEPLQLRVSHARPLVEVHVVLWAQTAHGVDVGRPVTVDFLAACGVRGSSWHAVCGRAGLRGQGLDLRRLHARARGWPCVVGHGGLTMCGKEKLGEGDARGCRCRGQVVAA